MWVFNKSFESIGESDIRDLVSRVIAENQNLEYKLEFGSSDDDKKEMARDISSIANAYGGYLIVGIREDRETGTPLAITGVENAENERDRIISSCLSNIDPRIPGLKIRTVLIQDCNRVILIFIPRSTRSPHMVKFSGSRVEFWRRHDRQKNPMSVEEIREAFLRTENIRKDIEEFINERKKEVIEETLRYDGNNDKVCVVGAAPLMVKTEIIDIYDRDLRTMLRDLPERIGDICHLDFGLNNSPKPTLYGLLIEDDFKKLEFYRNGYLELRIDMGYLDHLLHDETIIVDRNLTESFSILKGSYLIEYIVSFYRLLKKLVEHYGLYETFVGFLSLYNVHGVSLIRDEARHIANPSRDLRTWYKTHLEIPPMQILSFENPDKVAKDFLDRIWNALGYEMAPLFTHDGRFEAAS
ncbi:MAG TPA: ATP-binding protein [Thermodesulfobacteriota bacterium]|nr:ATP-binding protein [Thermodesulfobacteriota bacterium]